MLNLHQLERLLDEGQYHQLIDRILANGRATEPSIRKALTHSAILAPVALGLALQRAGELSYGPSELAERILSRLLDLQLPDGRFGSERSSPRHSIIVTAVALRGMLDYQHQRAFFRPLSLRERAGVRVPGLMKAVGPGNHTTQSSPLTPHLSSQSLAAAVERTVGALAAAVADEIEATHAARSNADKHRDDDLLPLQIVSWQLASHGTIAVRLHLPQIAAAQHAAKSRARTRNQQPARQALAA
jgi:hypothetical protein